MRTHNDEREEHVQWLEKLDNRDDPGFTDDQLTDEEFHEVTGYWRDIKRNIRVDALRTKREDQVTPKLLAIVLVVFVIPNLLLLWWTL